MQTKVENSCYNSVQTLLSSQHLGIRKLILHIIETLPIILYDFETRLLSLRGVQAKAA